MSDAVAVRPFPPGDYPVVVVGSGPGGLQTSYCLARLGVPHAVLSADDEPGGMFRHWPVFGRLLSWTKPDAPVERGTREYEWYDHNSLVGDEPAHQALVAELMDRRSVVPARHELAAGLHAFASRAGVAVRYGCRWEATRREDGGLVLETSDGEYRCGAAVFAVGVTEPWKPPTPGLEDVPFYSETRAPRDYRGRTVVVIGKRNSAFEIADALLPWARRVVLVSPRPVRTEPLATSSVRVRYMQPLEDDAYGGGTLVIDAAVERVERSAAGYRVHAQGTTRPGELILEADDCIAATGFTAPLRDLPRLDVATIAGGRIPALTPFFESQTVPGVYFAGNATQGAVGLARNGVASTSAAIHGFRYNARVLARHLAETRLGLPVARRPLEQSEVVPLLLAELRSAPELWAQKGYLARAVSLPPDAPALDDGIQPLAHVVDADGPDRVAVTVELDERERVHPVVYVRRGGEVADHVLAPHPVHAFDSAEHAAALDALVSPLMKVAARA